MEDQGKRLLIAVLISMAILFGWSWWTGRNAPPPAPAPQAQQQKQEEAAPPVPAAEPMQAGAAQAGATSQPAAQAPQPARPRGPEQKVVLSTPRYEATFSSYGGALTSWQLKGGQYTMKGPDGGKVPMDLVRTAGNPALYPFQVSAPDSTFGIPKDAEWQLEKKSDTEVVARWQSPELEVAKNFKIRPDTYVMELGLQVTNRSQQVAEERLAVNVFGYQDPNAKKGGMFKYAPPPWQASSYVSGGLHNDSLSSLNGGPKTRTGDVRWVGMAQKYFLLAVAPAPGTGEQYAAVTRAPAEQAGAMESSVVLSAWKLKPGDSATRKMFVYAGPKSLDRLEAVNRIAGGDVRLEASVEWGPPPTSWFTFIARPLLSLLKLFHGFVRNWGVAIILLTIFVKLLTLYWTHKSMRSMKEMSRLKPKIDELRKKYPNDKQRQNLEMMNLYKAHKVNPLGGCLPMLLQMPIWMALYSALSAAAELHQAPFVGWIQDLTAPDPYFILPVALTAVMFLQSKITPAAVDSAQQKMMMYMMPLMFGAFSLFFPAGLTLYIFTNTLLGMGHQYYLNRSDAAAHPAPAVAAAAASDSGKPHTPEGGGGGRRRGLRPRRVD